MSRAALLDSYYLLSCALVLTLFLFQKGQGFFPPLPIAALAPAVSVGHTYPLWLGMLRCGLNIFVTQNASAVSNPRWHFYQAIRPVAEWRSISAN